MRASTLLEITGHDIAQLGDADLRTITGLLCEADFRHAKLPVIGITWGGHQDAPDGGLDVVVHSECDPPATSFLKRRNTGIQVKKPDMQPAKITKEMRPGGILREDIKDLINKGGAYVIINSTGSTSGSALKARVNAMKSAIADEPGHENLHLDYLDQGRIATWVRNHPSLALWVHQKIGRPLKGWHPYENWSKAPGGLEEEYLLDEGLRLTDRTTSNNDGVSAESGLLKLRELLSAPGRCVRLAGLSGVGKTRFVQALFDSRIGDQALNTHEAIYTDISEGPVPDAGGMLDQLLAAETRAILIIDNCPPELHSQLARKCSSPTSTVSLLTVEYDVRDDLPDETDVFRLSPASKELIETLLGKRFQHVTQVDTKTIAEFSGGNARLAIALAKTVQKGETLSSFREEELFERLFWQRHAENNELLTAAEVLSLVYSFEGTDTSSDASELKFLSALIQNTPSELYKHVDALQQRDLIQSRGVWRAVLPHAVANRLARRALKSIPPDILVPFFINQGTERLIKSFSRRLSYLHDCDTAIDIVTDWLDPEGWLGKSIGNFNDFGMDVFRNIAPIAPEKILKAIESASVLNEQLFSEENRHFEGYIGLLRKLSYEPELFQKSVHLMLRFAFIENARIKNNAPDQLKSLFYAYLSGTKAPAKMRAQVIEELLQSGNPKEQWLGCECLSAALESWHFSSSYDFEFGARPRDYGYEPETEEEFFLWYETFIDICIRYSHEASSISNKVRQELGNKLRGLWLKVGNYDFLEDAARKIHSERPWREGWIAIKSIIGFDKKQYPPEVLSRIYALEEFLRPNNLLDKARIFAFSDKAIDIEGVYWDDENPVSGLEKAYAITRELGKQVAQSPSVFEKILSEIVSTSGQRILTFGEGLAEGASNPNEIWTQLKNQFFNTDPERREIRALIGFIWVCATTEPDFYKSTMDSMVEDDLLAEYFPDFQIAQVNDPHRIERLRRSLVFGKAKAPIYQSLGWGRAHEKICDDDLAGLLDAILAQVDGVDVVINILAMRFHGKENKDVIPSEALIATAKNAILSVSFSREDRSTRNNGYDLAQIIYRYFKGESAREAMLQINENLATAIVTGSAYAFDYGDFFTSVATVRPNEFLDAFLGNDREEIMRLYRVFGGGFERNQNPINNIPDDVLINWCEIDPVSRYPILASCINGFSYPEQGGPPKWGSIANKIFERAPNLEAVLDSLSDIIRPRSAWSGSLADILERRLVLFEALYEHENTQISSWAKQTKARYVEEIRQRRESEEQRDRDRDERFE